MATCGPRLVRNHDPVREVEEYTRLVDAMRQTVERDSRVLPMKRNRGGGRWRLWRTVCRAPFRRNTGGTRPEPNPIDRPIQ
jgi:hypothetical protein